MPSVPLPLSPLPVSERPVYVVAGGNHVTLLLDRGVSGGLVDVIDVLAQPGGGPPPHRHAFAEWFCVLAGELTISEERDGRVACTRTLTAGESCAAMDGPWNAQSLQRPSTISSHRQPGTMTGYFAQAGVRVPTEGAPPDRPPPGPSQLKDIAAAWGIEFWTGPIDHAPLKPAQT